MTSTPDGLVKVQRRGLKPDFKSWSSSRHGCRTYESLVRPAS